MPALRIALLAGLRGPAAAPSHRAVSGRRVRPVGRGPLTAGKRF